MISARDRGYLLGDGIFETILCYHNKVIAWDSHWHRLQKSALWYDLDMVYAKEEVLSVIMELMSKTPQAWAVVRLTLTRANSGRGLNYENSKSNLLITLEGHEFKDRSVVKLTWAAEARSAGGKEWSHKALQMAPMVRWRNIVRQKGFDDAIVYDLEGRVLETTAANIFILKDDVLCTPPLQGSVLPGTTRAEFISFAQSEGIKVVEKFLTREELDDSCEVFVCNAVNLISVVELIDEQSLQKKRISNWQKEFNKWLFA